MLRCCVPHRPANNSLEEDCDGKPLACNRVELAASELFSIPGLATAYHTSVLVNGEEFFFSDSGIFNDRALTSHQGQPSERFDVGWSTKTGAQLLRVLAAHFRPGTYDLIRKNCNSFSDVSLYYLLGTRLQGRFSALERLGQRASVDLLNRFTKGMYVPNKEAESYGADEVMKALDALGDSDLEGAGGASSGCGGAPRANPALTLGARVTVIGLRSAEALNGQGAQIVRFNGVNGRWEARVNISGEVKSFRAENLRPAGELIFEPGARARIHSLRSESGSVLNGEVCQVLRYLHDVSRYEVRLADCTKALKGENLRPVEEAAE